MRCRVLCRVRSVRSRVAGSMLSLPGLQCCLHACLLLFARHVYCSREGCCEGLYVVARTGHGDTDQERICRGIFRDDRQDVAEQPAVGQ